MLFFTPVSLRERRSFDEVFLSFFMFPRQSHVFKCKTGRVYFHVSRLTQWLSMDFKELFRPFAVAEPNVVIQGFLVENYYLLLTNFITFTCSVIIFTIKMMNDYGKKKS